MIVLNILHDEQIEDCIKKFNIELDPLEENNYSSIS